MKKLMMAFDDVWYIIERHSKYIDLLMVYVMHVIM